LITKQSKREGENLRRDKREALNASIGAGLASLQIAAQRKAGFVARLFRVSMSRIFGVFRLYERQGLFKAKLPLDTWASFRGKACPFFVIRLRTTCTGASDLEFLSFCPTP